MAMLKRIFRWRLRALLFGMAAVAVLLGLVGKTIGDYHREQASFTELKAVQFSAKTVLYT